MLRTKRSARRRSCGAPAFARRYAQTACYRRNDTVAIRLPRGTDQLRWRSREMTGTLSQREASASVSVWSDLRRTQCQAVSFILFRGDCRTNETTLNEPNNAPMGFISSVPYRLSHIVSMPKSLLSNAGKQKSSSRSGECCAPARPNSGKTGLSVTYLTGPYLLRKLPEMRASSTGACRPFLHMGCSIALCRVPVLEDVE